MKISLDNNLEFLYQWDIDRKIIITGAALGQEAHFTTKDLDEAYVLELEEEEGKIICNIPNILLQNTKDIIVYLYDGNKTIFSKSFKIIGRNKPTDYIYKETEVMTFEKLKKELKELIAARANKLDYIDNKLLLYADDNVLSAVEIETSPAEFTDDEFLEQMAENGIVEPSADSDGAIFTDTDNKIYIL